MIEIRITCEECGATIESTVDKDAFFPTREQVREWAADSHAWGVPDEDKCLDLCADCIEVMMIGRPM